MSEVPAPAGARGRLRIGPFELDPSEERLLRDGARVAIQDLPLRLLVALAERPGQTVRREELVVRLWGATYVDAEAGLNTAVRKLREALGDDADRPRYVETVPRRGYRLVATVEPSDLPAPALSSAAGSLPHRAGRLGIAAVGAAVVLLGAGAAYLVATRGASPRTVEAPRPARLLVVPFESETPDAALAATLGEDLIAHLGRVDPGRFELLGPVSARAVAVQLARGEPLPPSLGVTHLITGRIARVDGRLRATFQLERASDGVTIWSEVADPLAEPLGESASELLTFVSRAVAGELGARDPTSSARAGTLRTPAFLVYVKARAAWQRFDPRSLRESRESYREALELDPDYAEAMVGLAEAEAMLGLFDDEPPGVAFGDAIESARAALARAPELAGAHAVLALALLYSGGDLVEAQSELERALALEPARALTHQWAAALHAVAGRHDRALAHARRAAELEPLSLPVRSDLCWYFYFARRFGEARSNAATAASLGTEPGPFVCAELAARAEGDADAELAAMTEAFARAGGDARQRDEFDTAFRRGGIAAARRLELAELEPSARGSARYRVAAALTALGENDAAIALLEKEAIDPHAWWRFVGVDPAFDRLRELPGYAGLIRPGGS